MWRASSNIVIYLLTLFQHTKIKINTIIIISPSMTVRVPRSKSIFTLLVQFRRRILFSISAFSQTTIRTSSKLFLNLSNGKESRAICIDNEGRSPDFKSCTTSCPIWKASFIVVAITPTGPFLTQPLQYRPKQTMWTCLALWKMTVHNSEIKVKGQFKAQEVY